MTLLGKELRKYRPVPPYQLALYDTTDTGAVYRTGIFTASTTAEAMLGCLEAVGQIPPAWRERYAVTLQIYGLAYGISRANLGIVLDPEHDSPEEMDEKVGAAWDYLQREIRAGRLFTYSNPRKRVTRTWPQLAS
jgi:hypothetical protein